MTAPPHRHSPGEPLPPELIAPAPRPLPAWTAGRRRALGRGGELAASWTTFGLASALAGVAIGAGAPPALSAVLVAAALLLGAVSWRYDRGTREEWRHMCEILATGAPVAGQVVGAWEYRSQNAVLLGVKRTGFLDVRYTYPSADGPRTETVRWDSYLAERHHGFVPRAGDVVLLVVHPCQLRRVGRFPGVPASVIWGFARAGSVAAGEQR